MELLKQDLPEYGVQRRRLGPRPQRSSSPRLRHTARSEVSGSLDEGECGPCILDEEVGLFDSVDVAAGRARRRR